MLTHIALGEADFKRRPDAVFPDAVKAHLQQSRVGGGRVSLSCTIDQRYDADGRLAEVVVRGCDELAEGLEPALMQGWRRTRLNLPENAGDGARVSMVMTWRLR